MAIENTNPFEFARGDHDARSEQITEKNRGYLFRAWQRFIKNRASLVSLGIIILIVLFALFAPFFNTGGTGVSPTSRYMKLGPRNLTLSKIGIATGDKTEEYSLLSLVNAAAIGIGAGDVNISVKKAIERGGELQPLTKIMSEGSTYRASADQYLKVGFVYMYLEKDEIEMLAKEGDRLGIQVFYPLIAENEYNFAYTSGLADGADWWYKTDARGFPIGKDGVPVTGEGALDMQLTDNYMRDSSGETIYFEPSGKTMYKARVLFYNYYRVTHGGRVPEFLFGTDSAGYDLAYRTAVGIRLSLLLSLSVFAINFIIGAVWGAVGGYFGGRRDLVLQFISYVLAGVPFMVVATLFQIHLSARAGAIPSLLFAFVLTGWIGTASRVRTQFYRFKGREYIMAARTLGASDARIILKHIFPNALGTVITASVLTIPGVIFSESMLSYLGIINLGSDSVTSLGTLLSDAGRSWMSSPHLIVFPALVISLLMICFNLFGNGLRDALDPRADVKEV